MDLGHQLADMSKRSNGWLRNRHRHLAVPVPSPDVTDDEVEKAMSALRDSYTERTADGGMRTLDWDEIVATAGLASLEELRVDYSERIAADRPRLIFMTWRRGLLDAAAELAPVPDDESVEAAVRRQLAEMAKTSPVTPADQLDDLRRAVTQRLRLAPVLDAIADAKHLRPSEAAIEEQIRQAEARLAPLTLDRAKAAAQVGTELRRALALEWLFDHVAAVTPSGERLDQSWLLEQGGGL